MLYTDVLQKDNQKSDQSDTILLKFPFFNNYIKSNRKGQGKKKIYQTKLFE